MSLRTPNTFGGAGDVARRRMPARAKAMPHRTTGMTPNMKRRK